jgi:hypothetical protein
MDAPRDEVRHPDLRRLHGYWLARRGDRPLPRRADIDPLDLPWLLGDLLLIDVLREPLNFRFRVFGTAIVQMAGFDVTGKTLDQFPLDDMRGPLRTSYEAAVAARRPLAVSRRFHRDRYYFDYESLILPLGDGDEVSQLLIGTKLHGSGSAEG